MSVRHSHRLAALLLCGATPLSAAEPFPVVTMGIMLSVLGTGAVYLLYRHLKRLERTARYYRTIAEGLPLPMFWCDRRGRILGANTLLLDLIGTEERFLKGRRWHERLLPDEAALKARHLLHQNGGGEIRFYAPLPDRHAHVNRARWRVKMSKDYWIFVVEIEGGPKTPSIRSEAGESET